MPRTASCASRYAASPPYRTWVSARSRQCCPRCRCRESRQADGTAVEPRDHPLPRADQHAASVDRDRDLDGHRLETRLDVPGHRLFALSSRRVEPLPKSLPLEQGDADERQAEIGSGPQHVAGQDAEPARVSRQLAGDADLHREVGDHFSAAYRRCCRSWRCSRAMIPTSRHC